MAGPDSRSDTAAAEFSSRVATRADIPAIQALMDASIRVLLGEFLRGQQLTASFGIMGLDTQLIDDGTYYVIETGDTLVGCGGWSRRATFFGGDQTPGRDAALLDPATQPARIRAMYTHPDWARRGIGRQVLALCEDAARRAGFTQLVLVATLAGQPLYQACGYRVVEYFEADTPMGVPVPCIEMAKSGE